MVRVTKVTRQQRPAAPAPALPGKTLDPRHHCDGRRRKKAAPATGTPSGQSKGGKTRAGKANPAVGASNAARAARGAAVAARAAALAWDWPAPRCCCWPVSEGAPWRFCGEPAAPGSRAGYCAAHEARAWRSGAGTGAIAAGADFTLARPALDTQARAVAARSGKRR